MATDTTTDVEPRLDRSAISPQHILSFLGHELGIICTYEMEGAGYGSITMGDEWELTMKIGLLRADGQKMMYY